MALGDSMSIDVYPELDYADRTGRPAPRGLGAASLLHRNVDAVWPAFAGRDLAHLAPGVRVVDATADGAATADVLDGQLSALPKRLDGPALITLTAGGNDLLGLLGGDPGEAPRALGAIRERLQAIVSDLLRRGAQVTVAVATVYDPTDGTGDLDGRRLGAREMGWLAGHNAAVRAMAAPRVAVVDVEACFRGHGMSAPPRERWYWGRSSIEPGYRGAHELRRLWLAVAEKTTRAI